LGAAPKSGEVDVTDPEKKVAATDIKLNSYVTYRVSSKQIFAADAAQEHDAGQQGDRLVQSSVLRRFSDFVWLHAALTADLPDVLISSLPPGGVMNRFEPAFIEARRRGLAIFLQRCLAHEVIVRHPLLQTFLTGTDAELASARQVQEAAHKATPAATVKGWFSSATSLLSGALGQQSQQPLSKDDLDCRKMVRYVQDLQREFTRLVAQMEELLPAQDKLGKAFGALGVAADSLAQAEGNPEHGKSADASAAAASADGAAGTGVADADAPVEYSPPPAASSSASSPSSEAAGAASMGLVGDEELSRMLHLLALSAEVVRQRTHAKGEQEDVDVLEPLKDACRQAHAVEVSNKHRAQLSPSPKQNEVRQRCFSLTAFAFFFFFFLFCQLLLARREACLKECHELAAAQVGAARKLESSSAKAASSPSASADDKHAQRQQAADSSTFALLAKERELHAMTAAVRREFERAQAEKTAAVAFIVRSFIKLQIKHSEDNARTWAEMLKNFEEPTAGADA
jgi:hypothetical protein